MWINYEGKDSPMIHGNDIYYNHMTPHNRGVYALQANPGDDDNSTLTPNSSKASVEICMAQVCTVVWCVGQKATYHDTAFTIVGRGRYEPDPHTLYPHMTHVTPHDIPNLYNR